MVEVVVEELVQADVGLVRERKDYGGDRFRWLSASIAGRGQNGDGELGGMSQWGSRSGLGSVDDGQLTRAGRLEGRSM
jgi:hypothetical protein